MVKSNTLSAQQLAIVRLIGLGKSRKEIAQELNISDKTVEFHISGTENQSSIYRRLNVSSDTQIVRYAVEKGLVKRGETNMIEKPTEKVSIPECKNTTDLAFVLLGVAAAASVGQANPLQVNALCQLTQSVIELTEAEMRVIDRQVELAWISPNKKGGK
jgi:DNA-binding CsgD family transcriptional regulator